MNEPPPSAAELMTIDQTAEYLQCSRRSIFDLMKKKDFPRVGVGRLVRIVRSRLLPWLESPAAQRPAKVRAGKHLNQSKRLQGKDITAESAKPVTTLDLIGVWSQRPAEEQ